jgi:hypothetical protein
MFSGKRLQGLDIWTEGCRISGVKQVSKWDCETKRGKFNVEKTQVYDILKAKLEIRNQSLNRSIGSI